MFNKMPILNFPIYSGWNQYTPTIPKMYWDVYSAEQRMKELCLNFDKVEHYLDYISHLMNKWHIDFTDKIKKEFKEMWEQVHAGYKDAISDWMKNDLPEIINAAMKMVFFGLTDDGYFCAYIPNSWSGIIFDTISEYTNDNYGCLVLKY